MQFLSLHNLHALNVKAGTRTVSLLLVNVTCGRRRRVLSSCVLCLLILIGVSDLHLVPTEISLLSTRDGKYKQLFDVVTLFTWSLLLLPAGVANSEPLGANFLPAVV